MMNLRTVLAWVLLQALLAPVAFAGEPLDAALDEMVRTTLEARHRYRQAKRELHDLADGSKEWEAARRRRDQAFRDYDHRARSLDAERIRVLARESGVPPARIARMRDDGMGWGQIAKDVGVHPGKLGRGHHKARSGGSNAGEFEHEHGEVKGRGKSKAAKGPKNGKGPAKGKGPKKSKS